MKFVLSLILLISFNAFAQETTESTTLKKSKFNNRVKGDIDKEITDARMRAESGSKSRWSGSMNLTYNGASLEKPLDDERPNVFGRGPNPVQLSGSVGMRYRLNKNESLYLSGGISHNRPLDPRPGDKLEMKNPTLMYGNWFRLKSTQVRTSLMTYIYTEQEYKDLNYVGTLAGIIGTMNKIGNTRFEVGTSLYFSQSFFDGETGLRTKMMNGRPVMGPNGPVMVRGNIEDFQFASFLDFQPRIQFRVNDRLNFYTTIGLATFSRTRDKDFFDYEKTDITQTIGAGIALSRNFYLAPNIDFKTEDPRADETTVNLSAIVNVL